MFRRLPFLLVTVVVAGVLASTPATSEPWLPAAGAAFNNPVGEVDARTRLVRRVIAAINHTPKGETIRFAAYSFDRRAVADALIKAHRRGVFVQLILNDNWTSPQTRRLRRVLGHNPDRRRFVVICEGSCRGGPGNLHMKVYAFTKTGGATDVVMTGSANLTDRAVNLQWNDMVTLSGAKGLHEVFIQVFNQLKYDEPVRPRWITYTSGDREAIFYRTTGESTDSGTTSARLPTADEDPVLQRLRDIRCAAVKGSGINGRTVIRIIMYGWSGDRGKYLADRVAYMKRRGCDIKIITSLGGGGVIKILKHSGVPVKSADYDFSEEGVVNFYSHLKAMTVNGTYQGKPVHSVWTGSENWSPMSFRNDELILQINRTTLYRRYVDFFNYLWANYTHPHGIHPDYIPE